MPDPPYLGSAAPVFRVDGTVEGELARDLLRLDVEEDTDGLRALSARFIGAGGDADPPSGQINYLDGAILDFGRELEVSVGPPGIERTVFKGRISSLEVSFTEGDAPLVRVLAEDGLMQLRMTRRSRTYRQASVSDVAQAIAGEHGLSPEVDAGGPTYSVLQQLNQSDLAFLRQIARAVRAEVWIQDSTLHVAQRQSREVTTVTLVQGNELLSAQVRADLAHQRTEVCVSGYDAQHRESIDERADGEAVQAEITGGRSGPDVLQQAFGERAARLAREAPLTREEATAWARAEMLRRARAFVTVCGVTSGSPDLAVGSRVELQRVGTPFEGDGYYVTRARHTYDLTSGLRTHFEAERPTIATGSGA